MKKYAFSLLLFLLLFADIAAAGTSGIIEGHVSDKTTSEPLIGVNVIVIGTKLGSATDENGVFKIYNVPAGEYDIKFSMIGYHQLTIQEFIVLPNLRSRLNVKLPPEAIEMDELIVIAEKPLIRTDVVGSTHEVSEVEIAQLPIDNFQDVMEIQPGVAAGGHIRGGRKTEVLYLVDGLPIQQAVAGGAGSDLPKSAIQEISVQTGGFDAEYGNALSGVVNVITKRGEENLSLQLRADNDYFWGGTENSKMTEIEILSGGPMIKRTLKYFFTGNLILSDSRWWQDLQHFHSSPMKKDVNLLGKLDYHISKNIRFWIQSLYSYKDWKEYEFRWRYNLDGLPPQDRQSLLLSAFLSHNISKSTFYTLNVSRYGIDSHIGPENKNDLDLGDPFQYDFYLQYVMDGSRLWWSDASETRYIAKLDLTSQISDKHLIKIGGEFEHFSINTDLIKYEPQVSYFGKPLIDKPLLDYSTDYVYYPRKGAFYIQDKIELSGKELLSIGLRYDFLDPRADRPVVEWIPTTGDEFKQEVTDRVKAELKHQLSPRLGFAMPLSETSFVFLNYGIFFQVPLFEYMYSGLNIDLKKGHRVLVGNPDLKPEHTRAWEISYRKTFRDDLVTSVTYFSKEIFDLVDTKTFLATDSKALDDGFTQFVNLPYADSKGLEIALQKKFSGYFGGKLAYSYMVAKGLSETAQSTFNYLQWGFDPVPGDHYLSWDQRHTLNVNIDIRLPGDWNINILGRYNSPRPYTYFPSRNGITPLNVQLRPNNERMESNYYLDIKYSKSFKWRSNTIEFYGDTRNLFDTENLLWVDSSGKPGGELGDPTAYDTGRRTRIGLKIYFEK